MSCKAIKQEASLRDAIAMNGTSHVGVVGVDVNTLDLFVDGLVDIAVVGQSQLVGVGFVRTPGCRRARGRLVHHGINLFQSEAFSLKVSNVIRSANGAPLVSGIKKQRGRQCV
jgi:hypothetical protein